jgi:hypothetical protein
MIEGVQFAKNNCVKKVLIVGGEDAWIAVNFLKEHNCSC